MVLAESKFNLTLSAIQGHLIDGPATQSEFEIRMVCDERKQGDDGRIQGLIVDVDVDVHD